MENTNPSPVPRGVQADRAVAWWADAWTLFMKGAGMWIVLGLVFLLLVVGVQLVVPLLGGIVVALFTPVLVGGWMLAARKVEGGGKLELGDLFACFKEKLQPLVVLGALLLAAVIVMGLVFGVLGVGASIGIWATGGGTGASLGTGLFGLLLILICAGVVAMMFWYAPPLIVFRDVAPVEAMKASFSASLKNIVPSLVYGLLYVVAALVASIPAGLGWIVLTPVLMLTIYTSYKDLFG